MAVTLSLLNIAQFVRVAPAQIEAQPAASKIRAVSPDIVELSLARHKLLRLRDAITEAKVAAGSARVGSAGVVGVSSTGPLVLDNSTRAAVLESVTEINTTPTSFSPFGPDWTGSGSSTALITIGGVYDGSGGPGSLRFQSRDTGVHGVKRLRIRVRDTDNKTLANVTIKADDPLDQQYNLPNGLNFRLGAGALVKNDELLVNVFDAIGSAVITGNPFDGARNSNPNLDPGQSVPGGTVTINGVNVAVGATDSIDTIVGAINQSGAGVTAAFDGARERLVLTQDTPGLTPTVVIDSDDSGFAAATKLAGATVTPGRDADIDSPLANVTQFQGVENGTIAVNQTAIAIDVQTDSLRDVLDRINLSQTEATAVYTEAPQQVRFSSNRTVTLDDGTTGFLAALNIPQGVLRGGRGNGLSTGQTRAVTETVDRVTRRLSGLLSTAATSRVLRPLGTQFKDIVGDSLSTHANPIGGSFGLRLDSSANSASLDSQRLTRNLHRNARSTLQFLVGTEASFGLLDRLAANVDQALANLSDQLGSVGSIVNRLA